jgi:hypothetical protein
MFKIKMKDGCIKTTSHNKVTMLCSLYFHSQKFGDVHFIAAFQILLR